MGSNKKRQQTIGKRNRERAVEEKRTLKRERKQQLKAEKAAALEAGLPWPPPEQDPFAEEETDGAEAETEAEELQPPTAV
jgi:hypothetical protein